MTGKSQVPPEGFRDWAAERRTRVVTVVKSLPDGSVTEYGTHLSLEVRGRRFGWYLDNHHGDGRLALHCRLPPGVSASLVARGRERFHVPKHVGHRGWVGLWLDLPEVDWSEVEALLMDSYCTAAPKSLVAKLGRG